MRAMKDAISPRVVALSGLKVVLLVPVVTPTFLAHRTAVS